MGTWDVESTREQFLEVVGRNEILILRVLTNETGDVGTERDNPEIIDAGEIERYAGEFCSHALAFEWLRHFGVGINDAAGEAAITDKGAKAANAGFEAMSLFVVGDGYVVEIHVQGSPCGFADFFILAHEDLQVTGKVYQGIWKNYGVEESRGSLLKRRASSA